MFHHLYNLVYHTSTWLVGEVLLFLMAIWSFICALKPRRRRLFALILAVIATVLILHITLFSRGRVATGRELMPFSTLFRSNGRPGLLHSMVMNIFLFVPLGAALPFLFPDETRTRKRILLTIAIALCLSVIIELVQLLAARGMTQTDDVICNTLGAAIGACTYPLSLWIGKRLK